MSTPAVSIRDQILISSTHYRLRKLVSGGMAVLMAACSLLAVSLLWIILAYVIFRGFPALNFAFFTERPVPMGVDGGGVAPAILGSLYIVLLACLVAVPTAVLTAIYLTEFATDRFADAVRFVIDLLAGMPSIVIGVFVWVMIVLRTGSYSGAAGAIALAIIMIPIVARTVEAILNLVPNTMREASLALGVPTWKTILRVVVPAAKSGIITGVVLAMARAGGETAPLLLTALGNQFWSLDITQPMAALPVQIYTYAISPYADWHTKAWGSALILIGIIGALSLLARWAVRGRQLGQS
jgi:phosphate transport system permease protein